MDSNDPESASQHISCNIIVASHLSLLRERLQNVISLCWLNVDPTPSKLCICEDSNLAKGDLLGTDLGMLVAWSFLSAPGLCTKQHACLAETSQREVKLCMLQRVV